MSLIISTTYVNPNHAHFIRQWDVLIN